MQIQPNALCKVSPYLGIKGNEAENTALKEILDYLTDYYSVIKTESN